AAGYCIKLNAAATSANHDFTVDRTEQKIGSSSQVEPLAKDPAGLLRHDRSVGVDLRYSWKPVLRTQRGKPDLSDGPVDRQRPAALQRPLHEKRHPGRKQPGAAVF